MATAKKKQAMRKMQEDLRTIADRYPALTLKERHDKRKEVIAEFGSVTKWATDFDNGLALNANRFGHPNGAHSKPVEVGYPARVYNDEEEDKDVRLFAMTGEFYKKAGSIERAKELLDAYESFTQAASSVHEEMEG